MNRNIYHIYNIFNIVIQVFKLALDLGYNYVAFEAGDQLTRYVSILARVGTGKGECI